MEYYIYGYSDPNSRDPFFYIGKGKGNRAYDHLEPNRLKGQTHFYNRLNKMIADGIEPAIDILADGLSEGEALAMEIALIAQYGRIDLGTGCLCNHTDGGEGMSGHQRTEETRAKISTANRNRFMPWMSEDQNCYSQSSIERQIIAQRQLPRCARQL